MVVSILPALQPLVPELPQPTPEDLAGAAADAAASVIPSPRIEWLEDQVGTLPLAALAHALPTLLFAVSADRRHAYVNHHWLTYTGLGSVQTLREQWLQLIHPGDRERVSAEALRPDLPSDGLQTRLRLRDAQGRHRWHLLRARLLNEGERRFWVGHLVDIEAQKHAEDSLALRERDFRTLVDQSPDGITRMDRAGRHVYANAALLSAFGLDTQRLLGSTAFDAGLPHAVAAPWRAAAERCFDSGQEQTCEFSLQAADGEVHHYRCRLSPEGDVDGRVETVLCVVYDITHRRRTLMALQDSEQRFRQFAQCSDDVFWFADLARQELLYVSPAAERLWGLPSELLCERPDRWVESVVDEDRAVLPVPFFASRPDATGHEPVREYRVRRSDGTLRWVRDRRFVLQGNGAEVLRLGGITEDITDRKLRDLERDNLLSRERAARAEAEALASAKDEFLAVVSHELRSPLNAIRGWAHVLRKTANLPTEQLRPLDAIDRNVAAQARMVDDLLDTQRLLRGKVKLEIHRTPLPSLIEQAVETFRPQAHDKGIVLTVHHAADVPMIEVDAERLRQCLVNLLSNAVKFTPAGGHVTVRSRRMSSDRLTIDVIDTGVGLDPSQLEGVFEPFRQASGTSSTRRQGGLGLGLALARQLVELHGGQLGVRSDGPDHGATFSIELPAPPLEEVLAAPTATVDRPLPPLAGRRVMVLEDDPEGRQILELLLRDEQMQAVFFANAQDGFAHLLQVDPALRPEVLISDIAMPGEDGYSLIGRVRRLHQERGEPALPAVALTAFASPTDRRRALASGFDAHLGKPLDPELLRHTLKELLRSAVGPAQATRP